MKKIIILILFIIPLCGCDFEELNNLGIVTGLYINYEAGNYETYVEIINDKVNEYKVLPVSYIYEGDGKTLGESINNIRNKINKDLYFNHLELLVLNYNVLYNDINVINDYLLRSPLISNHIVTLLTNSDISKIASSQSKNNNVTSSFIISLIKINKKINTLIPSDDYDFKIAELKSKKFTSIGSIEIGSENIYLDNTLIINDHEILLKLNNEDSIIYNSLINKSTITITFDGIELKAKLNSIEFDKDISAKYSLEVISNTKYDLDDVNSLNKITILFNEKMKLNIKNFIKKLQSNNIDLFSLKEKISSYKDYDFNIEVNSKITKKGELVS